MCFTGRLRTIYDKAGRPTVHIDAINFRTTSSYDAAGQVRQVRDARNFLTTSVYDAVGQVQATVDALGFRTTQVYDLAGRQIATVNAGGHRSTMLYFADDQIKAEINQLGHRTSYTYDGAGRQRTLKNALGYVTTTVYDAASQVIALVDPLARRTTTVYDPVGQQTALINPAGSRTTTAYDAARQATVSINALGNRTTHAYDAAGQRIALTDTRGNTTSWTYDVAGQQTERINPLGQITTSAYDTAGRQTLRLDARGFRTTYSYDAVDRSTGLKYPDGRQATTVYDATGNRTLQKDWTGTYTRTYDGRGTTVSSQQPNGGILTFAWNSLTQRKYMVNTRGDRTTYTHDPAGRLTLLVNPQGDRTSYSYDALNRVTHKELANGTRASHTYDPAGQLTQVLNSKSDHSVICSFDYSYDAVGNRTRVIDHDGDCTTWTYDATLQLLTEHRDGVHGYAITHTWDELGNRLVLEEDGALTTSVYNAHNQLVTSEDVSGVTSYTYDAAGSLTLTEEPNGDLTTNTWDYENLLTQVELPNGDIHTYTFNSDHRRIAKEDEAGNVTSFLWDRNNILEESDDLGNVQVEYTYKPEEYGALVSQYTTLETEPAYYHYDALGSTMMLTDDVEIVTDEWTYKAFGEENSRTGIFGTPFRWVGEVGYCWEEAIGRYKAGRRWIAPELGRFASEDPVGVEIEEGSLYKYAANNPLLYVDPSGLTPIMCECQCSSPLSGHVSFYYDKVECSSTSPKSCCKKEARSGPFCFATGEWVKCLTIVIVTSETINGDIKAWRKEFAGVKGVLFFDSVGGLDDFMKIIKSFPDDSICKLILSGHNRNSGCGVGYNFNADQINDPNISYNPKNISNKTLVGEKLDILKGKLSNGAVVAIHSCQSGGDPAQVQNFANALGATLNTTPGGCGLGSETDSPLTITPPQK